MRALFIGLDGKRFHAEVDERHPAIWRIAVRPTKISSFRYEEIAVPPPPAFFCGRCSSTHPHIHMPTWTEMVSAELRRREAARTISIEADYPDDNWPHG